MKLSVHNWQDPFWFLKKNKEPPKGYIPYKQLVGAGLHIVPSPREREFLNVLSDKYKLPILWEYQDLYHSYAPLQVRYPESKKTVPLQSVLQRFEKENPEIVDGLLDKIKEQTGKKQYRYDVAPQTLPKDTPMYFSVSEKDAIKLNYAFKEMGWDIPLSYKDPLVWFPTQVGPTRISRYLVKAKRKFKNDKDITDAIDRALKNFSVTPRLKNWTLIVSAEPQDIKTMSTGKGWTSCVEEDCSNFSSLDSAVSNRDLVAYAISPEYDNWIARVWLRFDGKGGWWPESKIYQTGALDENAFEQAVENYLKSKNILGEKGTYAPQAYGWSDFLRSHIEEKEPEITIPEPMPFAQWYENQQTPSPAKEQKQTYKIILLPEHPSNHTLGSLYVRLFKDVLESNSEFYVKLLPSIIDSLPLEKIFIKELVPTTFEIVNVSFVPDLFALIKEFFKSLSDADIKEMVKECKAFPRTSRAETALDFAIRHLHQLFGVKLYYLLERTNYDINEYIRENRTLDEKPFVFQAKSSDVKKIIGLLKPFAKNISVK